MVTPGDPDTGIEKVNKGRQVCIYNYITGNYCNSLLYAASQGFFRVPGIYKGHSIFNNMAGCILFICPALR